MTLYSRWPESKVPPHGAAVVEQSDKRGSRVDARSRAGNSHARLFLSAVVV